MRGGGAVLAACLLLPGQWARADESDAVPEGGSLALGAELEEAGRDSAFTAA